MPSPIVALELIKSSMRLVGLISGNQTPKANESNDALNTLNDLLEEWSTDNLTVWGSSNQAFNTVANQTTYTIGPGGDFNTTRPITIDGGYCLNQGVSFPIKSIGQDRYNRIAVKTVPSQIIEEFLYVPEYPLGKVTFYPVPSTVVQVILSFDRLLNKIASLATTVDYPPGYAKALRFNLAVDLGAEYGRPVADDIRRIAVSSLASIKNANNQEKQTASFDSVLMGNRGSGNWREGV